MFPRRLLSNLLPKLEIFTFIVFSTQRAIVFILARINTSISSFSSLLLLFPFSKLEFPRLPLLELSIHHKFCSHSIAMEFFNDLYDTLYIIWQQMLLMMYEVILNAAVGAGLLESASCFPVETTSILHTVWYYVAISLGFIKPQTCYTYNGRILGASGYTVVNLGTIKSNSNAPPPFSGMSLVTRLQHPLYTDIKGLVIAIAVVACIIALFKIQWLPKHPEIVQDLRDAFLEARRKQAAASDVRIEHLSSELLSLTDQKQSLEDSNQSLRAAISLLKSFCNIEIESMSMAFNEHLNVFAIQVDRDLCKLGHKHQTTVQKLQTEKEQLWKNEGALTRRNQELSDLTVKITSDEREAFKFSYRNPLENAQTAVSAPAPVSSSSPRIFNISHGAKGMHPIAPLIPPISSPLIPRPQLSRQPQTSTNATRKYWKTYRGTRGRTSRDLFFLPRASSRSLLAPDKRSSRHRDFPKFLQLLRKSLTRIDRAFLPKQILQAWKLLFGSPLRRRIQ